MQKASSKAYSKGRVQRATHLLGLNVLIKALEHRAGTKAGLLEGKELGLQKGWEIGQEVGFYAGCIQVSVALQQSSLCHCT